MSKFSGHNWGIHPQHLRTLYIRAIERIIVYGSQIWYSKHSHITRKLQAIQRIPLVKICKAFRTIPNLTLQVVAKVPPIHLTIEREIEVYNINKGKNTFKWKGYSFTHNTIVDNIDKWETHPADVVSFRYNRAVKDADVYIYTDGSESKDHCGAAYVVMNKEYQILDTKLIKLPEFSNNFVAETQGILHAIKYIKTQDREKRYQILTDSLSTLEGLENPQNNNYFIHKIRTELKDAIHSHKIILTYVRGHQGNIGNDTADELAKQAAKSGEYHEVPISKQFIKRHLKRNTYEKWNKIWNTEGKNSKAYQWIKNVKEIPTHFPLDYYTTQAVSEHGRFPFYFERFGICDEIKCKCGETAENFDHYLDKCKITKKERNELSKKYKSKLSDAKQEIIKNQDAIKILKTMVKNINDQILEV